MNGFLLDTDICIYAMRANRRVLDRYESEPRTSIWVSVIVEAELRTGAEKSSVPGPSLRKLERFLRPLQIVGFTSQDAAVYAQVRARLELPGRPIGPLDMLIGAHALSRGLILVTNNVAEFSRIEGLAIENWAA